MSWRPGDDARRDKPDVTAAAAPPDARDSPVDPERAREVMASLPSICPGCGVGLQCEDKNLPGFFVIPKRLFETPAEDVPDEDGDALDDLAEESSDDPATLEKLAEAAEMEALADVDDDEEAFELEDVIAGDEPVRDFVIPADFDDDDFFQDGWLDDLDVEVSDGDTYRPAGDGDDTDETDDASVMSGAGGGGYADEDDALAALDALFDEPEDAREVARRERAARRRDSPDAVVCARCFSLRNYGKVKNEAAEILMPSFDFARVIGDRLDRVGPGGAVVLLVVDVVDFDGSFPADAVDVLAPYVADETVDVLLVANKVDLLPTQCTRTRVSSFARRRAKDLGLTRASGVHLISAHTGMGVNILSEQLEELLASGKEVWVVGAQNAGKSSIINRLQDVRRTGAGGRRAARFAPSRERRSASFDWKICCPTARTCSIRRGFCNRSRCRRGSRTRRREWYFPGGVCSRARTARRLVRPFTSAGWRGSTSSTGPSEPCISPCGCPATSPRITW